MVAIDVVDSSLVVVMGGLDGLWGMRRRIRFPLAQVRNATIGARVGSYPGWCIAGTHLPGILTMGIFRQQGRVAFWNVRRSKRPLVVDLEGVDYDRLVVEVPDPEAAVAAIRLAMQSQQPSTYNSLPIKPSTLARSASFRTKYVARARRAWEWLKPRL
ncbi:MAG: hypothetical protein ACRDJF_02355 [Actinomycetota bacterium]